MARFEDLLHHVIEHIPGLSQTNRQEYHDLIDGTSGEQPQDMSAEKPEGPEGAS